MRGKHIKRISKLKKKNGWLSIVLFLLACIAAVGILVYALVIFVNYLLITKLSTECEKVLYLSTVYDESEDEAFSEQVLKLIGDSGAEFIIRDAGTGDLLYGDVYNTCDYEGNSASDFRGDYPVIFYNDTRYSFISIDRTGDIGFDWAGIRKIISEISDDDLDEDLEGYDPSDQAADFAFSLGSSEQVRLPIWIGTKLDDKDVFFIGKGYVTINIGDLMFLVIVSGVFLVLFLVIFLLFIVNMVGNIRSQARAMKLFFFDLVTKGHNRMWFYYNGEKILSRRRNASYQYVVVNLFFAKYNTFCLCHSVSEGEEILRTIYKKIGEHLKKGELYAHGNPEEFMLLLKVTNQDHIVDRLNLLIKELENIEGSINFTYHIGASVLLPSRDRDGKIVRRKDIDLEIEYNNACTARGTIPSNEGSSIAFFDVKLVEEKKWQDQVEAHAMEALENEQFLVYYQPKYDPITQELKGAEALVRWQSPEFGFISPGKFIPIFESNGFITKIDHYMIEHVARDQKKWYDGGYNCVPVSVNVSRAHFIEEDLAEQIRDIVDKVGTPRELIEIELTESAFFDDKNALVKTIDKLREYGFKVSMDDFGSGYSSLNSLKDMPLDVLKIDAEFFRGDNAGERGRLVVAETIKLAAALNMKTVAEGVEQKEQVDFLASQGCDLIQGFFFSEPITGEGFEESMKARKANKY